MCCPSRMSGVPITGARSLCGFAIRRWRTPYCAMPAFLLQQSRLLLSLSRREHTTGPFWAIPVGRDATWVIRLLTYSAGIGKTVFIFYLMWRLRQIPTVTTVVQQVVGRTECFDFTAEQIIPRAELPLGPKPGWWFLFDSTAPPIGLGPAVLVTSPKCEILCGFLFGFFGNIAALGMKSGSSLIGKTMRGNLSCPCGVTPNSAPAATSASLLCRRSLSKRRLLAGAWASGCSFDFSLTLDIQGRDL